MNKTSTMRIDLIPEVSDVPLSRGPKAIRIRAAGEKGSRGSLGLLGLLLAVDEGGQLVGEDLLGTVQLGAFPLVHRIDLLEREEGQHADALEDVRVADIAPVLVELVRRGLLRIEPDGARGGLAHLLALGVEKQRDRHRVRILAELLSDQLGAGQHVGPLVIAAELEVAAVILVESQEIIALHHHVVELKEGEALLHALLVALCSQHVVDREARTDLAQELDIVEVQQPVGIVDHEGFSLGKVDKAAHLLLEAVDVVLDRLLRQDLAEVRASGRVTDHARAAA